jgi:hypothetical protein
MARRDAEPLSGDLATISDEVTSFRV